jgi:hypothetical protein
MTRRGMLAGLLATASISAMVVSHEAHAKRVLFKGIEVQPGDVLKFDGCSWQVVTRWVADGPFI